MSENLRYGEVETAALPMSDLYDSEKKDVAFRREWAEKYVLGCKLH